MSMYRQVTVGIREDPLWSSLTFCSTVTLYVTMSLKACLQALSSRLRAHHAW